ncbi:hypothetical protein IU486_01475 [Streptomyces gardneri]|uniref:hypothetical protein n=1 Tax=Nocardia TaxID=1817 RepID=UPI00135B1472|nr:MULTISPECIES: hypothetical protein [Nocardia]MBF6163443.1 hypothetical protein [Streptomyces gardneri]MBF6202585.1 hypothetical protein [Streptomyces gardneri]UAK35139.1 hypothetical protein K8O92_15740 [Nocardia asteroides]
MDLDRQLDAEPTDHDSSVAERITSPRLRRLLHTVIGLSEDSVDLLTTMTTRLRAAEGMILRDPLDDC